MTSSQSQCEILRSSPHGSSRLRHILVIDSDADVAEIMRAVLERDGAYRVSCVARAEEARISARRDRPAAAILEATTSHEASLALADELAGFGARVLITAGDPDSVRLLRRTGHRFLQKPFRLAALLAEIAALCG